MTPAQVDELSDGAFAAMVRLIERERGEIDPIAERSGQLRSALAARR